MGFYFFPRGGSAQVARYLCRALAGGPWDPMLFAGSLGTASEYANAGRFFGGVRCRSLDYTPAAERWADGDDPMSVAVPMHASYEDNPGVPDRIFVDLDDAAFARQVHSWTQLMAEHTVTAPSVVHLHHLTPIHEAVRALWPSVPVITHLHGTELKMLMSVQDGTIPDRPGRFSLSVGGADAAMGWRVGSGGGHLRPQPPTRPGASACRACTCHDDCQRGRYRDVLSACSLNCPTTHAVEALARRRSSWLVRGRRRGLDLIRFR